MNQPSQKKTIHIVLAIVILLIGVIVWYFFRLQVPTPMPSALQQNLAPALSNGNTTVDIMNDLNQIPDDSAALDQDLNSLGQEVKSF